MLPSVDLSSVSILDLQFTNGHVFDFQNYYKDVYPAVVRVTLAEMLTYILKGCKCCFYVIAKVTFISSNRKRPKRFRILVTYNPLK